MKERKQEGKKGQTTPQRERERERNRENYSQSYRAQGRDRLGWKGRS